MGNLQLCVEQPNGDETEQNRIVASSNRGNRRGPPDPLSISEELWEAAEQTTWQEVLTCIHATRDSEELRKDVIDYVQRLIRCSMGVEVIFFSISTLLQSFLFYKYIVLVLFAID